MMLERENIPVSTVWRRRQQRHRSHTGGDTGRQEVCCLSGVTGDLGPTQALTQIMEKQRCSKGLFQSSKHCVPWEHRCVHNVAESTIGDTGPTGNQADPAIIPGWCPTQKENIRGQRREVIVVGKLAEGVVREVWWQGMRMEELDLLNLLKIETPACVTIHLVTWLLPLWTGDAETVVSVLVTPLYDGTEPVMWKRLLVSWLLHYMTGLDKWCGVGCLWPGFWPPWPVACPLPHPVLWGTAPPPVAQWMAGYWWRRRGELHRTSPPSPGRLAWGRPSVIGREQRWRCPQLQWL